MMNRIKWLNKADIQIHLHYFSYNERGIPEELNQFCETVNVYERKSGHRGVSLRLPYIISSRINEALVQALQKDDHPILLEGIHCTGILPCIDLNKRKVVVRMHNEESIYYKELARSEQSWFKKIFFINESRLLKIYNYHLPQECVYACISQTDTKILKEQFHLPQSVFLPAFPNWQSVCGEEGIGNLCLYHGNLSVPENEEAALWLLRRVFIKLKMPLVIAGKKPSKRLEKLAQICQHTCLIPNPSEKQMDDLIRKAHIHVLPCFNKKVTGIRLKLLHALFEGRHCVVNDAMVEGTGLESACHIGNSAEAFASIISQLHRHPFTAEEINLRQHLLCAAYNNEENTKKLTQYLW
jgi:hypothetical protein